MAEKKKTDAKPAAKSAPASKADSKKTGGGCGTKKK